MALRRLHAPLTAARDLVARARRYRNDAGLTLIEMVVAIGIITTVLLSAGSALVALTTAQRRAEGLDRAVHLANDRLEQIRRVAWDSVGSNGPGSPTPDPDYPSTGTWAVEASTGTTTEQAVNLKGAAAPALAIKQTTTVGANSFTVTTKVTWAKIPNSTTAPTDVRSNVYPYAAGADTIPDYAHKRITLTVDWTVGGKPQTITLQTLRAPSLSEAVPLPVGVGNGSGCNRPTSSPFCTLYTTTGKVMTNNGTGTVTTVAASTGGVAAVQFNATTRTAVTSVTAKVGATSFPLTGSPDGKTWSLSSVGAGKALPLGPVSVQFITSSGASDTYTTGSWQTTLTAPARIDPIAGTTWLVAPPGNLRANVNRVAGDVAAPAGTTEPTAQYLCVDPAGALYYYQALLFDVENLDDMDGPAGVKPTVLYSGAPDGTSNAITTALPAANIARPTASTGSYDATTGYVGTRSLVRGTVNSMRWAASFPKGMTFRAGQTATVTGQSTITLAQTRPGDGVTAQAAVNVPVLQKATADDCDFNAPPKPTLTASASGTSVTATWPATPKATSYRLYKAERTGALGAWTFTQAYAGSATSYTYTSTAGVQVAFYLVASNSNGDSPNSDQVTTETVPNPSGSLITTYGASGTGLSATLTEKTVLSVSSPWTDSVTFYRSDDGAAPALVGSATSSGSSWSYTRTPASRETPNLGVDYVFSAVACNAAGCSPAKSGAVTRMPYWYGLRISSPVMEFTGDEQTTSGVSQSIPNTVLTMGGTFTINQPGSFRSDKSILFTTNAWVADDTTPSPSGAGYRTVEFSYKESGGFSVGWLFNQPGTTATNGFGAKNTASGTLTIGGQAFTGLKINDGLWHHYIISLYAGKIYILEDGVWKYSGTTLTTPINTPSTARFVINHDGSTANTGVSGWYDHFVRYNTALNGTNEMLPHWAGIADE